jgi:hypothetical protein
MTDKERLKRWPIVVTGFTGVLACKSFSDFHADVEEKLGCPVFTHELGNPEVVAKIKEVYRAEFLELVEAS